MQFLLATIALYYLVMGAFGAFSERMTQRAIASLYGASLSEGPGLNSPLKYTVKMVGLLALVMGYLVARAAQDPAGHADVIIATVALCFLRGLFRLLNRKLLVDELHVPPASNTAMAGVLFFAAGLLLWLSRELVLA